MSGQPFGKYLLLEPIASGGMADVYRAELAGPGGFRKEVALKLIRGDHSADQGYFEMFMQEASLASRLNHPNVVQVFECERAEGRYYIAMEYVHGRTLREVLDRAKEEAIRFGLARAVHVGAEVAKALSYAHRLADRGQALGIVHRDVSPHNVLIGFEGEVKLADFGIARIASAQGLTEPGTIKGKLAYMAPEQAKGQPVDGRADVFALGILLWEMSSGRRLFARDSDVATLQAVMDGAPISPPSAWNDLVPPELDAVVMKALERDLDRRTASAAELAQGLSAVLLKLARAPEDVDLRALMHKLWPDAAVPPSARPREATAVRPATPDEPTQQEAALTGDRTAAGRPQGLAAAPPAGNGGSGLSPGLPEHSLSGGMPAPRTAGPEAGTRTSFGSPPARPAASRTTRWLPLGIGAVVALAAAGFGIPRFLAGKPAEPSPPAVAPKPTEPAPESAPPEGAKPAPPLSPPEALPRPAQPAAEPSPAPAPPRPESKKGGHKAKPEPRPPEPAPAPPAPAPKRPVIHASSGQVGGLTLPARESGQGILVVIGVPWGHLWVDGLDAGETPKELQLDQGRHHLRVTHDDDPVQDLDVTVTAGERSQKSIRFVK